MDPETENEEGQEPLEEQVPAEQVPAEEVEAPEAEKRYVPYHQAEETGIIDTEINASIGGDMTVILTHILNKLDNIEKSTG